jgi:hypothetical protein
VICVVDDKGEVQTEVVSDCDGPKAVPAAAAARRS